MQTEQAPISLVARSRGVNEFNFIQNIEGAVPSHKLAKAGFGRTHEQGLEAAWL